MSAIALLMGLLVLSFLGTVFVEENSKVKTQRAENTAEVQAPVSGR